MVRVAYVELIDAHNQLKQAALNAIQAGESFNEFRKNIELKGFMPKNPYHLRTNFNTAVNNAHLAGQWVSIEKDKQDYPYLRYLAILDDRTRDEHFALHGIVRHVDDEFWDTHYPPNGWNCRCSVEQLTQEEADRDAGKHKKTTIKPNKDFNQNTGKERQILGRWLDEKQPSKYTKTHKELQLPKWEDLPETGEPPKLDIDLREKGKDELLQIMEDFLDDRIVTDSQGFPIFLDRNKAKKFNAEKYDAKAIVRRVAHLPAIDDTLQNPTEIWLDENGTRLRYMKKYEKGVLILVDMVDGRFDYFNIIPKVRHTTMDRDRNGFYLGR